MTADKRERESEAHWSAYCPPQPELKFAYQKLVARERHSFQSITGLTDGGRRERLRAPAPPSATLR